MPRAPFVIFSLVAACSSGRGGSGPAGPATFEFPTADDRWDGDIGVIGNVSGTRTPAAASRADFALRLVEAASCEHQIGVAVGANGSVQVDARPIVIVEGETQVSFSADTSAFSGRPIDVQLFVQGGSCGPVKVSVTDSTVTFVP